MGTDIHIEVQVFHEGDWTSSPIPTILTEDDPEYTSREDPTNRNYKVFAFLADVRNGFGFGGIPSHQKITPQFPRRGLPRIPRRVEHNSFAMAMYSGESLTMEGFACDFGLELGEHSFTHATLAELQGCDWELELHLTGIVGVLDYVYFLKEGQPRIYSGAIHGSKLHVIDNPHEFADFLESKGVTKDSTEEEVAANPELVNVFGRIFWKSRPLVLSSFYRWIFGDRMRQISEACGGPENVRVIMGFDS